MKPWCLKKPVSILLLLLFLFNVGGHYVVFWVLRIHADQEISLRIESNNYAADELLELTVPVTLPYPIQSQDYQRADGRFEHEGQFYKLVKHKLQNDTLYIVCLRDHETRDLVTTMDRYVELTQNVPSADHKARNLLSKLIKDYFSGDHILLSPSWSLHPAVKFAERSSAFLPPLIPVNAPPPRT